MPLASGELLALTGMMGSGKSTVARLLGRDLARRVVSTDALLVERFGQPIAEIFARHGEPAFREAERQVVASLAGPLVVDLGGGAFCDPASAEHLLARGRVVFLDVSEAEAARRIGKGTGQAARPLAADWAALLSRRRPLYARAQLRVAVDGLGPEAVARRILEWLEVPAVKEAP
jgi:shikimate kinase